MIEYELIRSNRKTLTIQVKPDGRVIVRAPVRLAKYRIAKFVKDHETWIFVQQEKLEKYRENMHVITDEERQEGILQAKKIFPERTAYFAERMGVTCNRIAQDPGNRKPVGEAMRASAGNLNFNWKLLVLMPSELLDYVVVHELAHRKEMNHWPPFLGSCGKGAAGLPRTKGESEKNGKTAGIKPGCFFAIHAKVMYNINIY